MSDLESAERQYIDTDGRKCSLDVMCMREPAWAASRIRALEEQIAKLKAEPTAVVAAAKAAGWGESPRMLSEFVTQQGARIAALEAQLPTICWASNGEAGDSDPVCSACHAILFDETPHNPSDCLEHMRQADKMATAAIVAHISEIETKVGALEAQLATAREEALREADIAITKRIEVEEAGEAKLEARSEAGIAQSCAIVGLEWARHELMGLLSALSPSSVLIKVRPVVVWFAQQMELKLRENDHKGGWHDAAPHLLLARVFDELAELVGEVTPERSAEDSFRFAAHCSRSAAQSLRRFGYALDTLASERFPREAADVANMVMMVADHYREGGPSQANGHTERCKQCYGTGKDYDVPDNCGITCDACHGSGELPAPPKPEGG